METVIGFIGSALVFAFMFVVAAGALSFFVLLIDKVYRNKEKIQHS